MQSGGTRKLKGRTLPVATTDNFTRGGEVCDCLRNEGSSARISLSKDGHKGQLRREPTRDVHVQDLEDASDRYASCVHTHSRVHISHPPEYACSDVASNSKPVVNLADAGPYFTMKLQQWSEKRDAESQSRCAAGTAGVAARVES